MGKTKYIVSLLMMLCFGLYGQDQGKAEQQSKQPPGETRGERTSDGDDAGSQQSSADTPGAAEASSQANTNNDRAGVSATKEKANTPAVTQTTTSSSGSPAVLSGKEGSSRDGTNNVQRASMNMAGSPANGLHLDKVSPEDANAEMNDRQTYSRQKESSEQNAENDGVGNRHAESSADINNNSRKENNAVSDQNLSSKDRKANQKKQTNRSKKKGSKG